MRRLIASRAKHEGFCSRQISNQRRRSSFTDQPWEHAMYRERLILQAARCRDVAAEAEAKGRTAQAEYLRGLATRLDGEVAEISLAKPSTSAG
jgi:hypothetical protein